MKGFVLGLALLAGAGAHAQTAADMQSAQTDRRAGETDEQHGRRLVDEMLVALGGDAWLNKQNQRVEGQSAAFFRGEPTGAVTRFISFKRYAQAKTPEVTRIEFVSYRGMIEPGTVRQVAHLYTIDQGYEFTFKGRTTLPEKQVQDFMRRRQHSLEELTRNWIKAPGMVIVYEGAGERDRRPIYKVSLLATNNDSISLELEQGTHLPLQLSYTWRNEQFKDHDVEELVYGDWRIFDGIATPMNMTVYRNADMTGQTFYKKVQYNLPLKDEMFDPEKSWKK